MAGHVISERPGTPSTPPSPGGTGPGPAPGSGPGPAPATPATPGAATPGILARTGCFVANQIPLMPWQDPTFLANPAAYAAARPYGWDTTAFAGVGVGAGGGVEAEIGASLSRAFPLVPDPGIQLTAQTMRVVRLLFGLFKMGLDVATGSPISFIRDALGIVPAIRDGVLDVFLGPLSSIDISLPS